MKEENPYRVLISGDFSDSKPWWKGDDTNAGSLIEQLASQLGHKFRTSLKTFMYRLDFYRSTESGTRPILDNCSHRQIIYCLMNFHPPPPPSENLAL